MRIFWMFIHVFMFYAHYILEFVLYDIFDVNMYELIMNIIFNQLQMLPIRNIQATTIYLLIIMFSMLPTLDCIQ